MSAHTPGPWDICVLAKGIGIKPIAGPVLSWLPRGRQDIQEANARLIAAAPDMLAALKQIEAALRRDSRDKAIVGDDVEYRLDGGTMSLATNAARDAIAKAEGRS